MIDFWALAIAKLLSFGLAVAMIVFLLGVLRWTTLQAVALPFFDAILRMEKQADEGQHGAQIAVGHGARPGDRRHSRRRRCPGRRRALTFGATLAAILAQLLAAASLAGPLSCAGGDWTRIYDTRYRTAALTRWSPERAPYWCVLKAQGVAESGLRPDARSGAGAAGIAQFMPGTWVEVMRRNGWRGTPWDAALAIRAQASYMQTLALYWRSPRPEPERIELMLASYNAGAGSGGRRPEALQRRPQLARHRPLPGPGHRPPRPRDPRLRPPRPPPLAPVDRHAVALLLGLIVGARGAGPGPRRAGHGRPARRRAGLGRLDRPRRRRGRGRNRFARPDQPGQRHGRRPGAPGRPRRPDRRGRGAAHRNARRSRRGAEPGPHPRRGRQGRRGRRMRPQRRRSEGDRLMARGIMLLAIIPILAACSTARPVAVRQAVSVCPAAPPAAACPVWPAGEAAHAGRPHGRPGERPGRPRALPRRGGGLGGRPPRLPPPARGAAMNFTEIVGGTIVSLILLVTAGLFLRMRRLEARQDVDEERLKNLGGATGNAGRDPRQSPQAAPVRRAELRSPRRLGAPHQPRARPARTAGQAAGAARRALGAPGCD